MFEPIQRYLPQYFNSDPEKREAIRLRAPAGTTAPWEIRDERLTIAWADQSRVFELHDHTVGSLVDALQAEGFVLDPGYDHLLLALGGVVLLEGRGTLVDFSGTPFYGFTSLLHAITRPVEREWRLFHAAIPEAVAQESIATADAEWLEVHGALYGIPRLAGMDDAAYRSHLIAEVIRPRNTPRGMEHSLRRLGYPNVRVREPWQEMHYLSTDATLSGGHHLPGAPIYEYHRLQLTASDHQAWAGPLAEAEADRPAGTLLLPPATLLPVSVITTGIADLAIASTLNTRYTTVLYYNRHGRLSLDLSLSDLWPAPMLPVMRRDMMGVATVGVRGPYQVLNAAGSWYGQWDLATWLPATPAPAEMTPPVNISMPEGYADLLAAIAVQQAAVLATRDDLDRYYAAAAAYLVLRADLTGQYDDLEAADTRLNRDETLYAEVQADLVGYAAALITTQTAIAALAPES